MSWQHAGFRPGARLVILPSGLLGQLPIWLARNPETGESLGERYNFTITPSLAALVRRPSSATHLPETAWFNEDAVPRLQLTAVARLLFEQAVPNANFISPQAATSAHSVIAALVGARVWQFWTHGRFDKEDVTRSELQLAGRTPDGQTHSLNVGDLLATNLGDRGPDLVILSACELALPNIANNDELIGLPVALIQAGARGVVSAMWPVREDATALLMSRFHELRTQAAMPASRALWQAQRRLRTATIKDLLVYLDTRRTFTQNIKENQSFEKLIAPFQDETTYKDGDTPFADPYYWAGFVFTGSDNGESLSGNKRLKINLH